MCICRVESPDGDREKGERAQCQSGQLDGNKAEVDGDAVDSFARRQFLSLQRNTDTHKLTRLHFRV